MDTRQSWECQGRQYHGWFGDGTCADDSGSDDPTQAVARTTAARRLLAIVHGAVGALSEPVRGRFARWLDRGGAERLARLLAIWAINTRRSESDFARKVLPEAAGLSGSGAAYALAQQTATASYIPSEARASQALAKLVIAIGADRWSGFVAAAGDAAAAATSKPDVIKVGAADIEAGLAVLLLGGLGLAVTGGIPQGTRLNPPEKAQTHQSAPENNHKPNVDAGNAEAEKPQTDVDLPPDRIQHILNGHRFGAGKPGKTEFPEGWDDKTIENAVLAAATDPNAIHVAKEDGREIVTGMYGGKKL